VHDAVTIKFFDGLSNRYAYLLQEYPMDIADAFVVRDWAIPCTKLFASPLMETSVFALKFIDKTINDRK